MPHDKIEKYVFKKRNKKWQMKLSESLKLGLIS